MAMDKQRTKGIIEIPAGLADEKVEQVVSALRTYFRGSDADVIVLSDGGKIIRRISNA